MHHAFLRGMLLAVSSILGLSIVLPLGATRPQPVAAQPQPATTPAPMSPFGMNTYFTGLERIPRDGDAGVTELIHRGRLIGATWAREELSWGNLERTGKGRRHWALFDGRLRETAEAGYNIIGMLLTTPAWARVADCPERMVRYADAGVYAADYWCPPANPRDFADYTYAMVDRYNGDGINDAPGSPRIAAWQIGNEPNAWETWPGTPAEYAALLVLGHEAVKAADPSATVVAGGVYVFDGIWNDGIGHRDGLSFLEEVFDADPRAWHSFDVLAIHPYLPTVAPDEPGVQSLVTLWGRIATTRAWLDRQTALRGGPPRPIWISEVGWSTCTAADAGCTIGGAATHWQANLAPYTAPNLVPAQLADLIGKSEHQQADYLVRTYAIALALGVEHISWLQLEDKFDGAANNFWQQTALLRTVNEGYALKPAAVAYAHLTQQLGTARFLGTGPLHTYQHQPSELTPTSHFHLRFLSDDGTQIEMLWRNTGSAVVELTLLPGALITLVGRDGQSLPYERLGDVLRFTISESPLYLRQAPPPLLALSSDRVQRLAQRDGPAQPVTITVQNTGAGSLNWRATTDAPWVRLITSGGQGRESSLQLALDPRGLPVGEHNATLHVTSTGGEQFIPLQLRVVEQLWPTWMPIVGR